MGIRIEITGTNADETVETYLGLAKYFEDKGPEPKEVDVQQNTKLKVTCPAPAEEAPESPAEEAPQQQMALPAPQHSLEEIRKLAIAKGRAKGNQAVSEIIKKYGAEKVSSLTEEVFDAVYADLEAL